MNLQKSTPTASKASYVNSITGWLFRPAHSPARRAASHRAGILSLAAGMLLLAIPASADSTHIPPRQWWHICEYSPDGSKVAVQTPPPEIIKQKAADGRIYKAQRDRPRKTVILNSRDFSLITTIDCQLWPTWSPDSNLICARAIDINNFAFDIGIYDASNGAKLRTIKSLPPTAFAWSPDSRRLFFTQSQAPSILDIERKEETILSAKAGELYFQKPQWSPDGKLIAASLSIKNDDKDQAIIRIWEASSGKVKSEFTLKTMADNFAWSPSGKYFIISEPSFINVLEAESSTLVTKIGTNSAGPVRFGWSPDKTKFYFGDEGTIHILDAATMKEVQKICGPTNGFFSAAWSNDSNYILISAQETAAICNAATGKYMGHKTWPGATRQRLSPDQKLLIIENLNDLTDSEPITLPPAEGSSPFKDGKLGSPGWEHNPAPKTLEDCFAQFDADLTTANREKFKNTSVMDIGKYGGGSFIIDSMMADSYGKWSLTEVKKSLQKLGITDGRNVIDILLLSYWRYLNKIPIDIDGQVTEHRSWWDNQLPIIEANRPLPADLLDCKFELKAGEAQTIRAVKAKVKVVSFVDTDGYSSAELLKCLKELRANHPDKDLAVIVCVVPPESLTKEQWPAIQTKVMGHGDEPAKAIALFQSSCKNIMVSRAPLALSQALFRMVKPTKYTPFGLPQTLLITEPAILKTRFNSFDEKSTANALERRVNEALRQ